VSRSLRPAGEDTGAAPLPAAVADRVRKKGFAAVLLRLEDDNVRRVLEADL
jgi:hypothetical protein